MITFCFLAAQGGPAGHHEQHQPHGPVIGGRGHGALRVDQSVDQNRDPAGVRRMVFMPQGIF